MRSVMKEIICEKIDELKSICLNEKYSDSTSHDISSLLSEVIDRANWLTLAERTEAVTLSIEQYEELLNYRYMYKELCD